METKRCEGGLVSFWADDITFRRKTEHFRNESARSAHPGHSGKTSGQRQKLERQFFKSFFLDN